MDSFTYVNIFETKGLEYLLLLSFWVLFVYMVRYLSPTKKIRKIRIDRQPWQGFRFPHRGSV
jgi:hypothetical protein